MSINTELKRLWSIFESTLLPDHYVDAWYPTSQYLTDIKRMLIWEENLTNSMCITLQKSKFLPVPTLDENILKRQSSDSVTRYAEAMKFTAALAALCEYVEAQWPLVEKNMELCKFLRERFCCVFKAMKKGGWSICLYLQNQLDGMPGCGVLDPLIKRDDVVQIYTTYHLLEILCAHLIRVTTPSIADILPDPDTRSE